MTRRVLSGVLLLILWAALAVPGAHAQNRRLQVIGSFSILADVVQHVAGDAADVDTLIPLGADPHTFEPSAQDVVRLSEADVVFVVGVNFEASLQRVLEEAAGDKVIAASTCVPVIEVTSEIGDDHGHAEGGPHEDTQQAMDDTCRAHQSAVEAAFGSARVEPGGALGLGACGEAACDPHVWTDPANAALWVLLIRDTLIRLDPGNADTYTQNTDAYLSELVALDGEIAALIDTIPPERRVIMTNHASLNYFALRYGLTLVGVVIPGGSTTAEPSVEDVINLIETVQEYHVPVIFTETTVREDLARQIADESGARVVQLHEGSLSEAGGPAATYMDYMLFNARTIAEALTE